MLVHDGPDLLSGTSAGAAAGAGDAGLSAPPGWTESVEREWLPKIAATLVPFESRRAALEERVPGARVEVVRPAVDLDHFSPGTGSGHGLAYVGGTASCASRDALEHFAADILPRLRSASGVQALEPISWIGPAREGDRQRYRGRGIDVTGYVEDIRPIVRPAACFVVPRRIEGGQSRILQAWAMGKAVVSTSVGCAG
ncbi:MAG: glycosyltransferase, partial [Gemmatimonadetes bacterium]|nr:glycosyltransferase [Gemmatimonadota bacterium]NIQ53981.1 glycosyltransferase [Gemmatimonadota bacterium]NIU74166.1 glycosyltransferase [Gammaproteobacteria bacterium]NIX44200.1 glycosyltransferase [Gemmatimonadota bacterium]